MNFLSVDVAVIGAGSAGQTAFRAARSHGKQFVLIKGGMYGTTCARVSCMPSKLLVAAAEAAHMMDLAPAFGVHTEAISINGRELMARVRRERDRFVDFVVAGVNQTEPQHRLHGTACFIDRQCLQIGDHTQVQADRIVVATGSLPQVPPVLHGLGERLIPV
ncbi:MAG: hypothetical protein NVSMB6_16840 [Burkholderiaceae bacterium]